jgi:hypothetical protein
MAVMADLELDTRRSPEPLAEVRATVDRFCDGFDAALITGSQAGSVVDGMGHVIRRLQAVQAAAVARVDACGVHRQHGFSSSAAWLADRNGTPIGEAIAVVEVARALDDFPATAERLMAGEVSVAAARQVTQAAQADPSAEASLLAVAETRDFGQLRERANRVRQGSVSGEDAQARHERLRGRRRFTDRAGLDGGVQLDGLVAPQDWAPAKAIVDRYQRAFFEAARRDGRRESSDAYRADAIIAAICHSRPSPICSADPELDASSPTSSLTDAVRSVGLPDQVNAQVTVLVDGLALRRGWATPGETCEIPGVGPVSVDWVKQLLPEAVATAVIHDTVDIRAYCSLTRHIPGPIRIALAARDRTCVVPGCPRRVRLQIDHRQEHGRDGPTTWDNLEHLCELHHAEKSYRGARLERDGDDWLWWPPPDPHVRSSDPPLPWRGPVGRHLNAWNAGHCPSDAFGQPDAPPTPDKP